RGYAPEGVERGDDGLRRGLSREHALVLLDVMLPGLSGFDVCRELRGALPQLPILMLTARGAEQDVLDGFRAGADDYVTKPFSVAELLARVEALLRRAGAGAREDAQEARRRGRRADPDRARGGLPVLGMTRIRIALALVSLAVLGLVALLAWRANEGLAAERAVRHEAVAERAFEEMERALSEF